MAVNTSWLCPTAFVTILFCFVALSDQVPADRYNREKDFLDAFGEWLRRAQVVKNVQGRADSEMEYMQYPGVNDLPGNAGQDYQQVPTDPEFNGQWFERSDWPEEKMKLGQIGGVAVDGDGDAVIFHRADRPWDSDTFFENNTYTEIDSAAISKPTIVTLKKDDGSVKDSWGENRFYLPHGLEIDTEGNYWVTDLALHQVFKFSPDKGEPVLTLGKAFEPAENNEDNERFCKPTDVAVASNGDFFVADGYCNSRILKYNNEGTLLGRFGEGDFWLPHSLALIEELDAICVADRENKRILCYDAGFDTDGELGDAVMAYEQPNVIGKVYAITYSKTDKYLYGVAPPTDHLPGTGFTIDLREQDPAASIVAVWSPDEEELELPHDLEVTGDGKTLYVGEVQPHKVWKFEQTPQATAEEKTEDDSKAPQEN